jgi:hypothetical protein
MIPSESSTFRSFVRPAEINGCHFCQHYNKPNYSHSLTHSYTSSFIRTKSSNLVCAAVYITFKKTQQANFVFLSFCAHTPAVKTKLQASDWTRRKSISTTVTVRYTTRVSDTSRTLTISFLFRVLSLLFSTRL